MAAAPMSTVRQALETCLLQHNSDFSDENEMTEPKQDAGCRNIQAMQIYLRLYLLVASNGGSILAMRILIEIVTWLLSTYVVGTSCGLE